MSEEKFEIHTITLKTGSYPIIINPILGPHFSVGSKEELEALFGELSELCLGKAKEIRKLKREVKKLRTALQREYDLNALGAL